MPRTRKLFKPRQKQLPRKQSPTPLPPPISQKSPEIVQPSDSELIFPDENTSSIITNPVAYDDSMRVINDSNVLSLRIHRVVLNATSRTSLPTEVKVCYVDFLFLGGTHETKSCPIANTMEL